MVKSFRVSSLLGSQGKRRRPHSVPNHPAKSIFVCPMFGRIWGLPTSRMLEGIVILGPRHR